MAATQRSRFIWGVTIVFIGAVCFSAKAILVKLAYRAGNIDAVAVLMLRMLFSLPFYAATAWYLARHTSNVRLTSRQWLQIGVLGLVGYYASSILDFMGLQYISAGLERLILFTYPTFALLMSAFYLKKKISRTQWLALAAAYTGILIAFTGDIRQEGWGPGLVTGSVLMVGCALAYAFYIVGSGELIPQVGVMKFTAYALMFSSMGVFIHYLARYGWQMPDTNAHVYWLCLIMALFATVLPTFMISAGVKRVGANNAAIIASVGPVATIIQAYFFLGEAITVSQLSGTALVLAGVLIIGWKGTEKGGK
ncbi:DMT family transporter [Chitinophaga pendula]|uniref:DMT family transporter n=1 Tax=Chitinophaga TaxID=79328 RepID=UPI000BAEF43F|nr:MULTISPECIES: DMT family transporter [Chitinophaga]ASZ14845.1 EamA family transporter [Chitinophaga sp. MD30]UCJ06207.1 DMT family transporter [Chitinophaga pendula]